MCSPACADWQVCEATTTTAACVDGALRVTQPVDGGVFAAGGQVPVEARLVLADGGVFPSPPAIPVVTTWGATASVDSGQPGFVAGLTDAGVGVVTFGWDGGPVARRAVEFQGCQVTCPEFQRCVPTTGGGRCETYDWQVSFLMPGVSVVAGPLQPNVPVEVEVQARNGAPLPSEVPLFIDGGVRRLPMGGMAGRYGQVVTLSTAQVGGGTGDRTLVAGWPDAGVVGLVATRAVRWDAEGPVLTVRPGPVSPMWKKDEVVEVEVGASEVLATARLTVNGVAVGGTPMVRACSFSTTCADVECRCFQVDLAAVAVSGVTGLVTVVAEGSDVVGNPGTSPGVTRQVTRVRWTRPISLSSQSVPLRPVAVTRSGVVVTAVEERSGTSGRVVATNPNGTPAWESVTSGTVTAGPVVGATQAYVATSAGTSQILPLLLNGGTAQVAECLSATNAFTGDMALATLSGGAEIPFGTRGGVVAAGNIPVAGCAIAVVPGLPTAASAYNSMALRVVSGNFVEAFHASTNVATLWKTRLMGTTLSVDSQVGAPAGTQVRSLFFTGVSRAGGGGGGGVVGNGNVFVVDANASLTGQVADSVAAPNSGPVAVGSDGGVMFWGGTMATSPFDPVVARAPYTVGSAAFGPVATAPLTGATSTQELTPILGGGGLVYVLGTSGELFVRRQAGLAEVWQGTIAATTPSAVTQMALDVYRDSAGQKVCPSGTATTRPALGVLYVLTKSGSTATLTAVVVDSAGLDNQAPWPKYQRDNGNTGNINSDISAWTCP
jgi:hypothetical protein